MLCCCVQAFSGCGKWGLRSSCGTWASHCCGCSCGAQALGRVGSVVVEIKPTSPVLAGRLFTTEPPGKPQVEEVF